MTDILLAFVGLFLLFLVLLGLRILIERKYPTYIKESLKGRLPDDCTVCAYAVFRHGHGRYLEYHFKKRKNGRYRLKYSVFDWIMTVIVWGGFLVLYIWLLYTQMDGIRKYPEVALGYALIGIALVLLAGMLTASRVSARWYFRRVRKRIRSMQ